MKTTNIFYRSMLLLAACFCISIQALAQNSEVKWLIKINPERPTSDLWKGVTNSVYPVTVATPVTMLAVGYLHKDKNLQKKGWQAMGSVVGNVVITQGLKKLVGRQRPYNVYPNLINYYQFEKDSAFPSGHTSNAFAVATTLSLSFKKWYVIAPAYLWAASNAYARLYLGQHYPTDVLAGAAVGVGSAFLSHWLTEKVFYRKKKVVK